MSGPDSEAGADAKVLVAGEGAAGRRLDQWLAGELAPDLSRSRVQALIRDGFVRLDGKAVTDPGRKVAAGAEARVELPEAQEALLRGEVVALAVLFEDDELIVIDKPAGLVVHPGAGNPTGTLVNALIAHCGASLSGIGGVKRPGIVHRLDKDTSGVMVVAKTDRAHRALADAFADHGRSGSLERAYSALVWGAPHRQAGTVEAALGRAGADRTLRAVVPEGRADARHAVTRWSVLERFGGAIAGQKGEPVAALLDCRLETGRTHQIRVHMAHIGHPLVGDADYGRGFRTKANRLPEPLASAVKGFSRQALHARLLAFDHPATGGHMRFETKLPADMAALVEGFRALG